MGRFRCYKFDTCYVLTKSLWNKLFHVNQTYNLLTNCHVWQQNVVGFSDTFNPLNPSSDKHLTSPYNITTWSHIQVVRIMAIITNNALMFHQILPTSNIKNKWKTVRRIWMLILGLKGFKTLQQQQLQTMLTDKSCIWILHIDSSTNSVWQSWAEDVPSKLAP